MFTVCRDCNLYSLAHCAFKTVPHRICTSRIVLEGVSFHDQIATNDIFALFTAVMKPFRSLHYVSKKMIKLNCVEQSWIIENDESLNNHAMFGKFQKMLN